MRFRESARPETNDALRVFPVRPYSPTDSAGSLATEIRADQTDSVEPREVWAGDEIGVHRGNVAGPTDARVQLILADAVSVGAAETDVFGSK